MLLEVKQPAAQENVETPVCLSLTKMCNGYVRLIAEKDGKSAHILSMSPRGQIIMMVGVPDDLGFDLTGNRSVVVVK